jgi:RNA polymerase sigma-70 factor (ECF subfamily)
MEDLGPAEFIEHCAGGRAGQERLLRRLCEVFELRLRRSAERIVRDPHAALDVVQDVLLKAWQSCATFRGDAALWTWLTTILRRTAFDHLDRIRPSQPLEDASGEPDPAVEEALRHLANLPDAEQWVSAREGQSLFRTCLEQLRTDDPKAAAVIVLFAHEQTSTAELALALGKTPGATRQYVSHARARARKYFGPWLAWVRNQTEASHEGR